jgi:hypothetical protein
LASLRGKELRPGQRIVEIQPPIGHQTLPRGPRIMEEELEPIPQDLPIVVVQIMDDASIAVGRVANALATATVFQQDHDTSFFRPMKSVDDAGLAGLPPHYIANQMFFGNGFAPGGVISGYDLLVFNSSRSSGTAQLEVELWTGDPLGAKDTACGDPPAPIAGTHATFSNLPQAAELCPGGHGKDRADECLGMLQLRADFGANKVAIDCDHVWMVIWLTEGCRLGWRWAGLAGVGGHAASIGSSDFIQQIRACSQFGDCATDSGFVGPGLCCDSGLACDHSDADDANWLACFNKGEINETFCFDNSLGYGISQFSWGGEDGYYASFVANIYAPADFTVSLKPVMPPASTKHAATATYTLSSRDGKINEAVLSKGGEPVWLEFIWSDFDPNQTGLEIQAWFVQLDASGYHNGLGADLDLFRVGCTDDAHCRDQLGPASTCNWPSEPGVCTAGFIDVARTDYIFNAALVEIEAFDLSKPDIRYASVLLSPPTLPSKGVQTYAATLVLDVPNGAKGTYTIGLLPPPYGGLLIDADGQFLPLLGLLPAKITVQLGSCCTNIGPGTSQCVDGKTLNNCLDLPTSNTHVFTPDATCTGDFGVDCPTCPGSSTPITPTVVDDVTLSAGQGNAATTGLSLKNRYISVMGGDPGRNQALRISVIDLPPPYDVWNGMKLWVDNVFEVCEHSGTRGGPPCPPGGAPGLPKPSFWAATLTCDWNDALFMDWRTLDLPVHIYNEVIVPSNRAPGKDEDAVYEVAFVDETCAPKEEASYSDPLTLIQPKWGDVLDACNKDPCGAPQGVTNIGDVTGILAKFQNLAGAPIKARADLVGLPGNEGELDRVISIIDVTWNLNAFIGGKYGFAPGNPCDGR